MGISGPRCPLPLRRREFLLLQRLVAYPTFPAVGQSLAFRAAACVRRHGAVVGEVTLASRARLAGLATGVESRFEVFPRVGECRGWFVLCAGRASVWPGFRRTFVAQPAAFSVLAQLPELESSAACAARLELIPLQLEAGVADLGVPSEVSQRPLLCAPCAP